MIQGAADPEVKVTQACELANEVGAGLYYVGLPGSSSATLCPGLTFQPPQQANPTTCIGSFDTPPKVPCSPIAVNCTGSNLIVYQGANHTTVAISAAMEFQSWVDCLGYAPAPTSEQKIILLATEQVGDLPPLPFPLPFPFPYTRSVPFGPLPFVP